jgi:nitroimidazol reductase NimA-like FMN-containing flavoprotein (pyridoxamine 5'-phosphate oxidase superfamily)
MADDRSQHAREIVGRIAYMVLATADADGRPWATPVWFATDGQGAFYWVSSPQARHSANIAARPDVGIVVFDSTVPMGTGQGVYIDARAEELGEAGLDQGLAVFTMRSLEQGGSAWARDDVTGEARLRMYRAAASSYSMLAKDGQADHRVLVSLD